MSLQYAMNNTCRPWRWWMARRVVCTLAIADRHPYARRRQHAAKSSQSRRIPIADLRWAVL